ncbi:MAG: insulinase family protein [Candidatus Latescibacterota bacterium]|nr:MAG: insulinase family protein [Candidatus Latescibacterota bacterium]
MLGHPTVRSRTTARRPCRWLVVSMTLCVLIGATTSAIAQKIFPYETHVETLDNGLKTMLIPMNSGGLVAYWTIVRTGARDEYEPGHTGFAHFFEHMMFRGSEKYPREVREKLVTEMGADANAFTSDDLTAYYLNIASEDLEQVIELESDRFKNLKYPEAEFKTEAGAVYGEYRKNRMNPFFRVYEAVHQEAFDVHTYGHTAMGYVEDIKAMPEMFEYSQSFFSRYYRPENVVVVVIGDIDVGRTRKNLQEHYGDWARGYTPPQVPVEPKQTKEKRIDVPYEGQSLPIVWISYKMDAFDPNNLELMSADVFAQLAFGETSDIHKKLVLEEQVVEFIQGEVNMNRDPGLMDIIARVKEPQRVDYVVQEIDRTIAHFKENLPDAQRLADLKSNVRYDFLMGLDTPMNVARRLYRVIAVTGGIEAVDHMYRSYDKVSAQDVQNAARKYFVDEQRTIAILRPGEGGES